MLSRPHTVFRFLKSTGWLYITSSLLKSHYSCLIFAQEELGKMFKLQ